VRGILALYFLLLVRGILALHMLLHAHGNLELYMLLHVRGILVLHFLLHVRGVLLIAPDIAICARHSCVAFLRFKCCHMLTALLSIKFSYVHVHTSINAEFTCFTFRNMRAPIFRKNRLCCALCHNFTNRYGSSTETEDSEIGSKP
jgi:hypothetical protein